VRQTLDDAGAVLATTNYDPWGTPQGALSAPFGFTGELHSAGQVYLRARWYAPGQGTFTSRDPFAGFPEMPYSLHAYQYGYSNSVVFTDPTGTIVCAGVCIGLLVTGGVIILAAVTHEATRSTQMAVGTMPPLDPSALIPMPDAATQARNRADFMRGVAYLRNPGAYVWVTPPMDPGPPDPVGYAGPSLQYPAREDLTVRSPRTGPEEVCVVWPGPSRQASLWPLTTGTPGEQVDEPLVWMAGQLPLFDQEGITYTDHFPDELRKDEPIISEEEALDAFLNGKKYTSTIGDAIVYKPVKGQPTNGITIVVDKSEKKVVTAWRGDEKRSWRRGWPHMTWYP